MHLELLSFQGTELRRSYFKQSKTLTHPKHEQSRPVPGTYEARHLRFTRSKTLPM